MSVNMERMPETPSTYMLPDTKMKFKRIAEATKRTLAAAYDTAADHELKRLGLTMPEADPSARNMTPESET